MKVGDIIKDDTSRSKFVYTKEGHEYCRSTILGGRIVKEIIDGYFLLQGDRTIWFKISDFESEPQYEIY